MSNERPPQTLTGATVLDAPSPPVAHGPPGEERTSHRQRRFDLTDEQALLQAGRIVEHLRSQLGELDRREQNLNSQLSSLEQEQRLFRLRVREFEEQVEERTRELKDSATSVNDRGRLLDERLAVLEEQEQEVARQRTRIETERAELKQSVVAEVAAERDRLSQERSQLTTERAIHRSQMQAWDESRQQQANDLAALRSQIDNDREQQTRKVERDEVELARRARFHEDHLNRFRTELDAQRSELERDRQRLRVWKEQVEESLRLRLAHVRRYRDLIEEREASLVRGEEGLTAARLQAERELITERERLARERDEWDRQTSRDRNASRLQQERLQAHSRSIDERRQQLDTLREELERTQQEILEQQMVVEQARATFADAAGQEEAGHRIEQARKALLDFHRQLVASTEERRQELQSALRQLHERRLAFRDEREALGAQLTDRESQLERQALKLHVQIVGLHEREHQWRQVRDRWADEKRQAEQIIRDLVVELEQALSTQPPPEATTTGPESISDEQISEAA